MSETKIDLVFSNEDIEIEVRHEPKITDDTSKRKGKICIETDRLFVEITRK